MRTEPTLYLRFVERDQVVEQHPTHSISRTVRVLQQSGGTPNGTEAAGDMFDTRLGEWRDVPLVPRA